jgi:hypothetical protein
MGETPVKHPTIPPVFVVNTAMRLRRALLRAADAVVPGYLAVMDRFMGAANTRLVATAANLRIADMLVGGPLSVEELATRTNTDAVALDRTLRVLTSINVFRRLRDGRYANNKISASMVTGTPGNIRGFARFFDLEEIHRAWGDLPNTLRDGSHGFARANGRSVWEWMAEDEEARTSFVEGMSSMTEEVAHAIAAAYPFQEVSTVCDVGGGVGIVLAAVLRRHPHLRGVLFDHHSMLDEARAHLSRKGISDRVELAAGSFFESIPRGADAYLLKTVLHNWPDEDALRILRNCRAAMEPGQRLVVEDFLGERDTPSTLVPYMDLAGMLIFSGRERSPEEFDGLFTQVGFRTGRVVPIPGSQVVIEAVAV